MKRTKVKGIAFAVVMCLFLGLPLVAAASAQPLTTVKVNGEKLLGPEYFPDIVMLEAKAKMDGGSLVSGSGSVHGIVCGATFFFELSEATVGASVDLKGTIIATNMGHHGFYGWLVGIDVEVKANLDGSNMHLILHDVPFPVDEENIVFLDLDFAGSGQVVL